jgi:hypothetical protein
MPKVSILLIPLTIDEETASHWLRFRCKRDFGIGELVPFPFISFQCITVASTHDPRFSDSENKSHLGKQSSGPCVSGEVTTKFVCPASFAAVNGPCFDAAAPRMESKSVLNT